MTDIVLVLTTVPSADVGEAIARALVEERLAACVNVVAADDVGLPMARARSQRDERTAARHQDDRATAWPRVAGACRRSCIPTSCRSSSSLPVERRRSGYLDWVAAEIVEPCRMTNVIQAV